ncbi:uncharacterized protein LOC135088403 [Ostrinia nubilalis]|uniref:uncharacterized protein LOC135088403 n=1 Tax=Ostrinia nubilalis TaxID=29057 RepID=UPI0030825DE4
MSKELAYLPLVPPLAVAIYVACVAGAGALANCSVLAALLKSSRNGLCSIIIQLAAADFLIIATSALPEIWFYNSGTWDFGKSSCIAYRGLNVFASTASSYLTATVALHTIASLNLEEKFAAKRLKRHNEDESEEMGSSHHSLMASSDTSTPPRTMNVDYRLMDKRVRVTPPTAFVWILSASLSIPEFALASTVHLNQGTILCTAIDSHHRLNMHSLLAAFNLFLPSLLMMFAAILIVVKLKSKHLPELDICDANSALKLSLCLLIVYGVLCAPRSVSTVYHVYSRSYDESQTPSFDIELLDHTTATIRLALSGAYVAATLIRPLLYVILLPKIRNVFSFGSRNREKV